MTIQRYECDEQGGISARDDGDFVYFDQAIGEYPTLKKLKELFRLMSDDDRLEWLDDNFPCCDHCGSLHPNCQCWNDE